MRDRVQLPTGSRIFDVDIPGSYVVTDPSDIEPGTYLFDVVRAKDIRNIGYFLYLIVNTVTGILIEVHVPDH